MVYRKIELSATFINLYKFKFVYFIIFEHSLFSLFDILISSEIEESSQLS